MKFIRELRSVVNYVKILAHIRSLVFGLFLRYLPFVIEQGKLYSATPPLYGITAKGGKKVYFADTKDYVEYVQNIFCSENKVANISTKKEYTKKELVQVLYRNIDYAKLLEKVSNTYAIDPYFLEYILFNYKSDYKKFKTAIEKAYKFITVSRENNCIMIRGLVGNYYQTIFLNNRLLNDCKDILNLIAKASQYYIINGKKSSLYELMCLFRSFEPKNMTRYKGLGEMEPEDLGESTVLPGKGRTLKRYTIKDVKEELKYISELQNDKTAFIKDVKIRKEDIV